MLTGEGDAKAAAGTRAQASRAERGAHGLGCAGLSTIGAGNRKERRSPRSSVGHPDPEQQQWEDAWSRVRICPARTRAVARWLPTLGLKLLERWAAAADKARAKLVLWPMPPSLRAMKAEPPFCNVCAGSACRRNRGNIE